MNEKEAILKILKEQLKGYVLLLDLLRREKAGLLEFNAATIEELSKEKDTLVFRLKLLDDERTRLMQKFTYEKEPESTDSVGSDMSLSELYDMTGIDEFRDIRLKLKSVTQSIKELNDLNRVLIDRSLNYINNNTRFLDSFGIKQDNGSRGVYFAREA